MNNTIKEIEELSRKIEGFTPLSRLVPDCICPGLELNLLQDYLSHFDSELTAANFHSFAYGKLISK